MTIYLIICPLVFLAGFIDAIAGAFNVAGNYIGAALFTKDSARFTRPVILIVLAVFFVRIISELI